MLCFLLCPIAGAGHAAATLTAPTVKLSTTPAAPTCLLQQLLYLSVTAATPQASSSSSSTPSSRSKSSTPHQQRSSTRRIAALVLVFAVALLIRFCVSTSGYSGFNTPPHYGDYEAQRHWMEV